MGARKESAEQRALTTHLVRRYRDGVSLSQLSAEVGRSFGYVRRLLLDAGVVLRPRGGRHRSAGT